MTRFVLAMALPLFVVRVGLPDTIHLKSGKDLEGVILQQDADQVLLAFEYGSCSFPRSEIETITKDVTPASAQPDAGTRSRIATWSESLKRLAAKPYGAKLQQIPATVIDNGVLRYVPYVSYRSGTDGLYEVNIYGDPDQPACVEMGVYGASLRSRAAKLSCVDFIMGLLLDKTDAALVRSANLEKDLIVRNGLTVEITPETAEDAYGGWWVSVYEEAARPVSGDRART